MITRYVSFSDRLLSLNSTPETNAHTICELTRIYIKIWREKKMIARCIMADFISGSLSRLYVSWA